MTIEKFFTHELGDDEFLLVSGTVHEEPEVGLCDTSIKEITYQAKNGDLSNVTDLIFAIAEPLYMDLCNTLRY
jgi:hypothetical protein